LRTSLSAGIALRPLGIDGQTEGEIMDAFARSADAAQWQLTCARGSCNII
jgi:hypothetical protein